jgi:hypothetical protein
MIRFSDREAFTACASSFSTTETQQQRFFPYRRVAKTDGDRDVPAFTVRLSGPRWRGRDLQDGRVRNEDFHVRIDRSGSQHRALDELGTEETPLPPCWRPPFSFRCRRPVPIGRLSAWQLRQRHRERSGGSNVSTMRFRRCLEAAERCDSTSDFWNPRLLSSHITIQRQHNEGVPA